MKPSRPLPGPLARRLRGVCRIATGRDIQVYRSRRQSAQVGKPLFTRKILKRHVEKWRAAVASGEPFESEVRFRRAADAQYRWFLTRAVPLRDARGKILKWYGISTDIEDRRTRQNELQAELAHINRVSTMGELAASLAHELRQPIAATITNANTCFRWLRRDQPDLEKACEATTRIVEDQKRAADMIERLRSLYKKSAPKREVVEMNEIVHEMVVLLWGEANRYAVSMRTDLAADLPKITADRVQLQQVLMNLMLNAIEAMKETGGVLTSQVATRRGRATADLSQRHGRRITSRARRIRSSMHSLRPKRRAPAWGWRSAVPSSSRTVAVCGQRANDGRGATFYFTLPSERTHSKLTA